MSATLQENREKAVKKNSSTNQKVKPHKQQNAMGRYLRRRSFIRDGKEIYKSRIMQRALKKALNKNYVRKENSFDAPKFLLEKEVALRNIPCSKSC